MYLQKKRRSARRPADASEPLRQRAPPSTRPLIKRLLIAWTGWLGGTSSFLRSSHINAAQCCILKVPTPSARCHYLSTLVCVCVCVLPCLFLFLFFFFGKYIKLFNDFPSRYILREFRSHVQLFPDRGKLCFPPACCQEEKKKKSSLCFML